MKVTNIDKGPRGLNTNTGPLILGPSESADVEMTFAEKAVSEATGWFNFEVAPKPDPTPGFDPASAKVEELKAWLTAAGVAFPDGALKADLQALVATHSASA